MKHVVTIALAMGLGCAGPGSDSEAALPSSDGQPKRGILVMAHGGDDPWNRLVEETVAPLRDRQPVEIAFGMARTSTIQAAVRSLERQGVEEIAVVRMFISADSFLQQTEVILGMREPLPDHEPHAEPADSGGHHMEPAVRISSDAVFHLSREGIADSPLVDPILTDRVAGLSTTPEEESVLILAHGPGDDEENERWLASMRARSQMIRDLGPFRQVQVETLREDWPEQRQEAIRRIRSYVDAASEDGGRALVVPFRVAGFGPYADVLEGLDYVADGKGFTPHPNMTLWVEQAAARCFANAR